MPELRDAAERLVRHYPQTSLNPDAMLALDVLAVRDALKREPEREAAIERLCEAVDELLSECVYCEGTGKLGPRWVSYAMYKAPDGSCRRCHDGRAAVAAVRGREEREGG